MGNSEADEPLWLTNRKTWQQEFKDGIGRVKSKPSWLSLELTAICNLRCVQCPRENPNIPFIETEMDESIAENFCKIFHMLPTYSSSDSVSRFFQSCFGN
jgi:hypothetical protein